MFWWLTKKGRKKHEEKIREDEQKRVQAEIAAKKKLEEEKAAAEKAAAEKAAAEKAAAEKAAAEKAAAEKAAAEKAAAEKAAEKAAAEKAAAEKAAAEKAAAEKAATEKAAAEKAAAEKATAEKAEKKPPLSKKERELLKAQASARAGRWQIEKKDKNEYISVLKANNGETMLTSEIYASEDSARTGIDTIIKNITAGKFVIYEDKRGNFYFKLKTAGNKLLCVGEIYQSRAACESAVERIRIIAAKSPVSDEITEDEQYIKYEPAAGEFKPNNGGKWKITREGGKFTAKLYASNGVLMLSTEAVSTLAQAQKAVENVQKNARNNNFVIDRDKNGKFYYKLRNMQKSTICVGESYDTVAACSSAIESVKKFCGCKVVEE